MIHLKRNSPEGEVGGRRAGRKGVDGSRDKVGDTGFKLEVRGILEGNSWVCKDNGITPSMPDRHSLDPSVLDAGF